VEALHEALHHEATRAEAFEVLRTLIDKVAVRSHEGGGSEVEVVGEIAAMAAMSATNGNAAREGAALSAGDRRSVKMVAGTRNHLYRTVVEGRSQPKCS